MDMLGLLGLLYPTFTSIPIRGACLHHWLVPRQCLPHPGNAHPHAFTYIHKGGIPTSALAACDYTHSPLDFCLQGSKWSSKLDFPFIIVAISVAEMLGYIVHRSQRKSFLKNVVQSRTYEMRLAQVADEKERIGYELAMAQHAAKKALPDWSRSIFDTSVGTNSEIEAIVSRDIRLLTRGSAPEAASDASSDVDSDVHRCFCASA